MTRRELLRGAAGVATMMGAVALLPGVLGLRALDAGKRAVGRLRRVVWADRLGPVAGRVGGPRGVEPLDSGRLRDPHDRAG